MSAGQIPTGSRTWLDPVWRTGALSWTETTLAGLGRAINGPVEQPHVRPWSTAMRIPTDGGVVWFKATGPGTAHERPLLEVFRGLRVKRVLLPIVSHPSHPWSLFEDASPTLRMTGPDGDGDHDLAAWERILPEYAELQRSVEGRAAVEAMLAAGTPDGRPGRLLSEFERLQGDEAVWARVVPGERVAADLARGRLAAARRAIHEAAATLEDTGIPATIQHDDLHGGNIFVSPDGDLFFDWGDASVAHPFATLTATFNSIAYHTARSLDDPVFDRLRDVYLDAWTDRLPRDVLGEVSRIARAFACIGKALAWERALRDLAPDEMDGHGDAVAGWLMEFAEVLSNERWATR